MGDCGVVVHGAKMPWHLAFPSEKKKLHYLEGARDNFHMAIRQDKVTSGFTPHPDVTGCANLSVPSFGLHLHEREISMTRLIQTPSLAL